MAWLNAVPKRKRVSGGGGAEESRAERMSDGGKVRLPLPPVSGAEYLLDHLYEVGPTMGTGMGAVPLTFAELESWQGQVGIELQPWEVRMLRRLSRDYAVEQSRATSADRQPPWKPEPMNDAARQRMPGQLRAIFGALRQARAAA